MKKVILNIDVTETEPIVQIFVDDEKIDEAIIPDQFCLSEKLLTSLDGLLKSNQLAVTDLSQITVNPGPGSYTSLRIATTVANFLAFSLDLPVFSSMKKYDEEVFNSPVVPNYPHAPVITKRKARP